MKKIIVLLLLASLFAVACNKEPSENELSSSTATEVLVEDTSSDTSGSESENPTETDTANNTSPRESQSPTTTKKQKPSETTTKKQNLPEYVPGSIKLLDNDYYGYGVYRPYRLCYYRVPGEILNLVSPSERGSWQDDTFGETIIEINKMDKMLLVEYIKRFNVSKKDFDAAIEIMTANRSGEAKDEEYEIPNSDIIYTFDYEIINDYYRYE